MKKSHRGVKSDADMKKSKMPKRPISPVTKARGTKTGKVSEKKPY